MRGLLKSILGLATAVWYDCVWFWSCSSGFGSDVRFFIVRDADVTGDPEAIQLMMKFLLLSFMSV